MGVFSLRAGIMRRESWWGWSLGEGLGVAVLRPGSWGMNPGQMSWGRHHGVGFLGQETWGGGLGVGSWDRGLEAGVLGRGSVGWLVSQSFGWSLGVRFLGW